MKQLSLAVAMVATGFVGAASAYEAPGEDPIKDGQTVHSAAASTGDPIKDGQTLMALSGNDLGASAPSRPNYSLSANWQVYVYSRGNVRFVQINDAVGVVRIVVGSSLGSLLSLPLGVDADRVTMGSPTGGTIVYRDSSIEIVNAADGWFVRPAAR
ncbi:MAG: hypothetical protein GAK28_03196 [Luteibacter sp.]|uniref:hypothetical protein n=1 Tax=Luteibacter sp. TaxID=1886636 RepID=UPI00137F29AF|nr:hypothetical protein [Luteibacter sp.]KAF1005444.1 MAG: hypothetical protein GAK28_03196 [Luteibacter sp.]